MLILQGKSLEPGELLGHIAETVPAVINAAPMTVYLLIVLSVGGSAAWWSRGREVKRLEEFVAYLIDKAKSRGQ